MYSKKLMYRFGAFPLRKVIWANGIREPSKRLNSVRDTNDGGGAIQSAQKFLRVKAREDPVCSRVFCLIRQNVPRW